MLRFPEGFVWGSATAALQIEGEHGRGPSVWDDFCRNHPERVYGAATPAVACDHARRWEEDLDWIARLGHTGYRFSISWPRVVPDGVGRPSAEGLDLYDRLVDGLLARGVQPNVTLYHWDLPSALGSWENPQTVDRFLEFATACFERLGDRVPLWATLNEPAWTTLNGYVTGLHPPCRKDFRAAIRVAHRMLTAHQRAVQLYRQGGWKGGVGIALNLCAVRPASGTEEDRAAAHLADGLLNRWFVEPVLLGCYPADVVALYERCGLMPDEALPLTTETADWVGVNYYYPHHAAADAPSTAFHLNTSGDPAEDCVFSIEGLFRFVRNADGQHTAWGWEIDPSGLHELLLRAHAYRPGIPVYVTENGIALADDGLEDDERIRFLRAHLEAVHRAITDGVNVCGYLMWSLMDNFSWVNGYKKRYGFLRVDPRTLARSPRRSAEWFREGARANGF